MSVPCCSNSAFNSLSWTSICTYQKELEFLSWTRSNSDMYPVKGTWTRFLTWCKNINLIWNQKPISISIYFQHVYFSYPPWSIIKVNLGVQDQWEVVDNKAHLLPILQSVLGRLPWRYSISSTDNILGAEI